MISGLRIAGLLFVLLVLGVILFAGSYLRGPAVVLAPETGQATRITFFAFGDQGTVNLRQWQVARRLGAVVEAVAPVHFGILLGDSFYPEGVSSTDELAWRYGFENMYRGRYLSGMRFYAVLGNHDVMGRGDAQVEYARERRGSGRWQMPARHYLRDFGRSPDCEQCPLLRVVFLDTTRVKEHPAEVAKFLEQGFAGSRARWRVVAAHHPIFNFGYYSEDRSTHDALAQVVAASGVHLYLSGHDHDQQLIQQPGETACLIIGTGGKQGYEVERGDPSLRYVDEGLGFALVDVDSERMEISLYGLDPVPLARYRLAYQRDGVAGLEALAGH